MTPTKSDPTPSPKGLAAALREWNKVAFNGDMTLLRQAADEIQRLSVTTYKILQLEARAERAEARASRYKLALETMRDTYVQDRDGFKLQAMACDALAEEDPNGEEEKA